VPVVKIEVLISILIYLRGVLTLISAGIWTDDFLVTVWITVGAAVIKTFGAVVVNGASAFPRNPAGNFFDDLHFSFREKSGWYGICKRN